MTDRSRFDITAMLPAHLAELVSTGHIACVDGQLWRDSKVLGGTAASGNAR